MIDVKEALKFIDPSTTSYPEWIAIGMALKDASKNDPSITFSDFDNWSSHDTRPGSYKQGACERKWHSFNSSGITAGTIIKQAMENGFSPFSDHTFDYGDSFIIGESDTKEKKDLENFLKALFKEDEFISYVLEATKKEDKYSPASAGQFRRTRKQILDDLEAHGTIEEALGDYNKDAGGWIRINPVDGQGIANKNVTAFRYVLIENDTLSIEEQYKKIIDLKLPCVALVHSGSRSIHAIMHVDAGDLEEYKKRVKWIYETLEKHDFPVDQANKNPSRLSRIPGLKRGGKTQELIALGSGFKTFSEWEEWIKNGEIELPPIVSFSEIIKNPPPLKDEMIKGVLRQGHKLILHAASKTGKSFTLIDLATAISEGGYWLKFKCTQGKVLYINLEIDEASFWHRIITVYDKKGWTPTSENIEVLNLRGKSMGMRSLVDALIPRIKMNDYSCIILDPIYKVQAGDENSAGDISKFTNEIDRLCNELNVSMIYCHHHSKGMQHNKKSIDRSSGSGVFARDADAIIDIIELSNETYLDNEAYKDKRAFRIEGTLREFKPFEPFNVFYDFPIYKLDKEGILDSAKPLDEELNGPKTKEKSDQKLSKFLDQYNFLSGFDKEVDIEEMMKNLSIKTDRTFRKRVQDLNSQVLKKQGKKLVTRNGKITLKTISKNGKN